MNDTKQGFPILYRLLYIGLALKVLALDKFWNVLVVVILLLFTLAALLQALVALG